MNTVGILGGLSWQSTATYYRLLNEGVAERLGARHSADLRIWSGDFEPVYVAQEDGRHAWIEDLLCSAAEGLVAAGADLLAIASNTSHRYAAAIERRTGAPLVHIIDATAERVRETGMETVLLLGTGHTMAGPDYCDRMASHGIRCTVPGEADRAAVNGIIFDELVRGVVTESSRRRLLEIVDSCAARGAQGVILGCTELGIILSEGDAVVPGFDTTRIHCHAIVEASLS